MTDFVVGSLKLRLQFSHGFLALLQFSLDRDTDQDKSE